jgi:hypothetical protein
MHLFRMDAVVAESYEPGQPETYACLSSTANGATRTKAMSVKPERYSTLLDNIEDSKVSPRSACNHLPALTSM